MNAYNQLARRTSAGFISVRDKAGEEMFINTNMIVNVVEKDANECDLNLYGGEMSPEGEPFCKPLRIGVTLKEVHEKIDRIGCNNFLRIKGVQAIFNTDYSFHFSPDNCATPIGMCINVPGTEIYDQVDLVSLPPLRKQPSYHHLADSEKGIYWVHVNLILGLLSEGNSNYWHVCLLDGKSVRVRGPLRVIFKSHPNLQDIPLVNVKDGILLNLNHTRYFNSGKNLIRLCEKVTIENSFPHYEQDEFIVEKSEYKKEIKEFLHTGIPPIIHFRKKK